ncbi:MAG TPA: FkbM family methyltransferase [Kofleriaceae bacterium]|nr:FkbM family methyltransferase [Kofleriaceae bacterium]
MTRLGVGFGSASSIASGPFRWSLTSAAPDRWRFALHRAVIGSTSALRLRGGLTLSRWLARVVGDYAEPVTAEAGPDVRLSFPGFDRYWMRVFFRGDFYEPELYHWFRRIRRLADFALIDGGANIGFWSALLTSGELGITRAVAVEASPTTYDSLRRTAALCGDRFATLHRALTAAATPVTFEQGVAHASRHIVSADAPPTEGSRRVTVEGTTVDALVGKYGFDPAFLIVKLDVEGAELASVQGGADAFARGAIFVYEDHGKDARSVVTGELLALGAACWFIADDGSMVAVDSAAHASRFKLDARRGYNFVCTSRAYAREHPLARRLFG